MAAPQHDYGPACELRQTRRKRSSVPAGTADVPPPLATQFFYASRWHVDDSSQYGSSVRLLPFTELDNARLEGAWRHYARSALGLGGHGARQGRTGSSLRASVVKDGAEVEVDQMDGPQDGRSSRPRSKDDKAKMQSATESESAVRESFLAEGLGPDSTDDDSEASSARSKASETCRATPNAGRSRSRTKTSLLLLSSSLETTDDREPRRDPENQSYLRRYGQTFPIPHHQRRSDLFEDGTFGADGSGRALSPRSPRNASGARDSAGAENSPRRKGFRRMDNLEKPEAPSGGAYPELSAGPSGEDLKIRALPAEPPELVQSPRRTPGRRRMDSLIAAPLAPVSPSRAAEGSSTPGSQQKVTFPAKVADRENSKTKLKSLLHRFRDQGGLAYARAKRPSSRQSTIDIPEPEDRPATPALSEPVKPFCSEAIGLSRLYMVQFPEFEMKPLYWDPTADKARACRGTWFYKSTMRPVRQDLANQLELGYKSIKPWTETYDDEVKSCLSIGSEAEIKIVHDIPSLSAEDAEALHDQSEVEGGVVNLPWKSLAVGTVGEPGFKEERDKGMPTKRYVMYADAKNAQILSSSQLPGGKRKILSQVREGKLVGIPVVRGFEQENWEKFNLSKNERLRKHAKAAATAAGRGPHSIDKADDACIACQTRKNEAHVTDLLLVVHGIGQKYSKKSENWRFMHAMNDMRAEVMKLQKQPEMLPIFRRDLGQIMVLPVEWRTKFSPEGEGNENFESMGEGMRSGGSAGYKLSDVTVKSIPNVREIINDVMVDIPYYMSGHREDMEQAMVQEANRIYRLWCRHNPGFTESGRVHIVAHSLGSVMALSALSRQPTFMPKDDPGMDEKALSTKHFDFDTKNVFFCGSPVGFFLLLQRANLIPRRERKKPGYEATRSDVGGRQGQYGSMAVDNVYNIIHFTDPVSYRINACVDPHYTSLLKDAILPSGQSWFAFWGRRGPPPLHRASDRPSGGGTSNGGDARPRLSSLPSTVEMEEHQFQREERAERAMRHLNDNGQIDWYIRAAGGAFEYLNILSAHSSYWTTPEFVRFLVAEVGREPGPEGAIAQLKAQKKHPWRRSDLADGPV